MQSSEEQVATVVTDGEVQQEHPKSKQVEKDDAISKDESGGSGLYSDQQNIDAECEKLLRNTKKQVKQMMEEAVTKKFIHEESSSIISLCVAVDACLSHGLKRRALGLFKTSSSTALIQKVSKSCKCAQEVLDTVEIEDRKALSEQQNSKTGSNQQQSDKNSGGNKITPKKVASNINVHKRNKWIKVALIDKKLVGIVDYLAENAAKYYEPEALMANYLCAQILSSLLVGPSALEFSRSKTNDHYQFDDPSADELLKRHKLANPIACLCSRPNQNQRSEQQQHQQPLDQNLHNKLERSSTETLRRSKDAARPQCRQTNSYSLSPARSVVSVKQQVTNKMHASDDSTLSKGADQQQQQQQQVGSVERRSPSPSRQVVSRRRPLALKTNAKRGTIITDCHHYSCQEISEHHPTRGYSFLSSINGTSPSVNSTSGAANSNDLNGSNRACYHHEDWSPRMLHETLHQNPKSILLYAKNNVLLETQPHETMAGYLSLHQTNSDLILKWIPNQMINGSQATTCSSRRGSRTIDDDDDDDDDNNSLLTTFDKLQRTTMVVDSNSGSDQQMAVESSYLDLVVSLSISRIVLLHCQFGKYNFKMLAEEHPENHAQLLAEGEVSQKTEVGPRRAYAEETLILVEADGVQRAPFKFPKGGLRLFLSCLENGLRPDKYLDPAIKFDDGNSDPLHSPPHLSCDSITVSSCQSPFSKNQNGLDSPSAVSENSQGSRLDSLLRRLPSLKRRAPTDNQPSQTLQAVSGELKSGNSETQNFNGTGNDHQQNLRPLPLITDNYVYRIVSIQQPDWPLLTPPHSALSVGGSSSGSSPLTTNQQQALRQTSSNIFGGSRSGQTFRWSLTRLARFSARYTNSGSSSSSSMPTGNSINCQTNEGSCSSLNYNSQAVGGENNSLGDDSLQDSTLSIGNEQTELKRDNSSDLARIEAKLDDLKKSTSEEILALRTQSIQTLCESMRKQILARAFYGWLAHCRKVRIVRGHLLKLIHLDDKCCLVEEDETDEQLRSALDLGLTQEKWKELLKNERQLDEDSLRREVNQFVYYGGVESIEMRREVWPYLLGHYNFTDDSAKKFAKDNSARERYESCSRDWIKIERVVKQRDNELLAANMAKAANRASGRTISETSDEIRPIDKPTTDSNNDISDINEDHDESQAASNNVEEPCSLESETNQEHQHDEPTTTTNNLKARKTKDNNNTKLQKNSKRRKRRARLESTGSVGSDASITDQYGNNVHRIDKDVQRCDRNFWYFKDTKNLEKLRNIMCTYVWKHLDIGYVQGMCDLAAPFLVIFDDELMAYNCFSQLMKRMESNFPHGCAMDQHFESLKHLMQILDPKLFDILQSNGDYTHFYFCYRWLLLDFKRELAYEDVYKVWETIWSARVVVTDHFVVFMALAMVRYYRDIIIENNMDFTDTIKFFNEMAERHDAKGITALARDCIVELKNLIKTLEL